MKAAEFAYAKPASLAEALDLLARPSASVLAGGQSLIPSLNLRLASPELLVDITGLKDLARIAVADGRVRVGALATHAQLGRSPEVAQHLPLLAQAVPHVAHTAIRNRGTLGGSLALADPAAEYPACAVALDAVLCIAGKGGERRVGAAAFFKDLFQTDLRQGELLVAVEFPMGKQGDRSVFLELARRQGDYAIIGLAAHNRCFVYFGAGPTPVVAVHAAAQTSLADAKRALAQDLAPPADLYHSSAAKLHLAGVLLERAWNAISTSN